ncbi:hypothetical protein GGQ68_001005 [Sagittula marina]|uniref:Uncharacterized protein n=1 Tax=Sagittula marina TaxID=943940 RepID=A0A7W6DT14_9RHOB|nr:hypothetical protein [Sagittula marina]MBB3984689.1 hypothetical protein [Sagittula marina]
MTLAYHSQLRHRPYPDQVISGDFNSLQLETADDFAAYRAMAQSRWAPILVSFSQKYQILDRVLAAIEAHLDDDYDVLLTTLRVPGAMRFPKRYYDDRLFLVADLAMETARQVSRGARVLVMQEGLVRHPMETGQNELVLTLHNADAAATRFAACGQDLAALGFDPMPDLALAD